MSLLPRYTSAELISEVPIRAVPIFFIQIVKLTPVVPGAPNHFAYVVTILKSVRILLSVAADADENVPTMPHITGRTATIRIAAATTPVISSIAETKVSEDMVLSYPVREVHPVFFHLLAFTGFLFFCRYGGELNLWHC